MSPSAPLSDPFRRSQQTHDYLVCHLNRSGRDQAEQDTVEALNRSILRFGADSIDSAVIEREHCIPERVLQDAARLGLFGLTIPEEFGGAGLSLPGSCGVIERLASLDRSVATCIGLHNGLGLRGLIRYAGEHLKKRYLPEMASGERIAAFAATEPNAGSDLSAIRASAVPDPALPDQLTLNGEKIYITNATYAKVFTAVMFTPGLGGKKRGHSLVLVPADIAGLTLGREEDKLGLRGSSTRSVHFDEARVHRDHVIGEPGLGITLMNHVLTWGRTLMAAGCLGSADFALRQAAAHVTTRRQFGRTLSEFELVRQSLAAMRARLYLAESVVRAAALICDQNDESASWETAAAKVLASESAWWVIDTSLQLHGGSGFIEETGIARALRDCRVTRIFEGANDVLRLHVAGEALTWPLSEIAEIPPLSTRLSSPLRDPALVNDGELLEIAATLAELRRTHGIRLIERQSLLSSVGTMALWAYAARVTLLRTEGILGSSGPNSPELDLAQAACQEAHQIFLAAKAELKNPTIALRERIARRELERASLAGL